MISIDFDFFFLIAPLELLGRTSREAASSRPTSRPGFLACPFLPGLPSFLSMFSGCVRVDSERAIVCGFIGLHIVLTRFFFFSPPSLPRYVFLLGHSDEQACS